MLDTSFMPHTTLLHGLQVPSDCRLVARMRSRDWGYLPHPDRRPSAAGIRAAAASCPGATRCSSSSMCCQRRRRRTPTPSWTAAAASPGNPPTPRATLPHLQPLVIFTLSWQTCCLIVSNQDGWNCCQPTTPMHLPCEHLAVRSPATVPWRLELVERPHDQALMAPQSSYCASFRQEALAMCMRTGTQVQHTQRGTPSCSGCSAARTAGPPPRPVTRPTPPTQKRERSPARPRCCSAGSAEAACEWRRSCAAGGLARRGWTGPPRAATGRLFGRCWCAAAVPFIPCSTPLLRPSVCGRLAARMLDRSAAGSDGQGCLDTSGALQPLVLVSVTMSLQKGTTILSGGNMLT